MSVNSRVTAPEGMLSGWPTPRRITGPGRAVSGISAPSDLVGAKVYTWERGRIRPDQPPGHGRTRPDQPDTGESHGAATDPQGNRAVLASGRGLVRVRAEHRPPGSRR